MFEAIILGIVQGLTEFLPVSSSAHLIVFPWFFKWEGAVNTLSFDVALHFGTLLALLVYFRRDWIEIAKSAGHKDSMLWKLAIGTIPAGIAGVLFHDWIETNRNPMVIVVTLCIVSVLMLLCERHYSTEGRGSLDKVDIKTSLFIGLAQACALIPGVSRSGITIVAGLSKNMKREDAARFSFLLGTPAIAGAALLTSRKIAGAGGLQLDIFVVGIIVSAITGYIAVKYLMLFLKNYSLRPFAYYRFLLAFVIILATWINM